MVTTLQKLVTTAAPKPKVKTIDFRVPLNLCHEEAIIRLLLYFNKEKYWGVFDQGTFLLRVPWKDLYKKMPITAEQITPDDESERNLAKEHWGDIIFEIPHRQFSESKELHFPQWLYSQPIKVDWLQSE